MHIPESSAGTAQAATASWPSSSSGPRCALAVTAGGESGDPRSPHFDDQAARYASGRLRPVYVYPEDLIGHTERTYHPGS